MALSLTMDVTDEFNRDNGYVADMSGWDTTVWQFRSPSGTISITATNDSGSVTGSVEGNSLTATSFNTIQATLLTDGTAVTSVVATGLYKVGVSGRYIKFSGAAAAATKVIIEFSKIM